MPCRHDTSSPQPVGPLRVIDILRRFAPGFLRHRRLDHHKERALDWICACRTAELGGRKLTCGCGWSTPVYNSCKHRHCPQCQGGARHEWLVGRLERMLPVPHFQVVATLPEPLRALAWHNPRVVYQILFTSVNEMLQQLAHQRLDATLGIVAVLHTWRNDLLFHPHVHCLVTAGGLRTDGQAWVRTRLDYLFPNRQMAPMLAGKVIERLRKAFHDGRLHIPGNPAYAEVDFETRIRRARHHRWVIHVEPPEGRDPAHVMMYLARYVQGPPISDARLEAVTETEVRFSSRQGPVQISGEEFVRRFVMHILPRRFQRVRYYGLYATASQGTDHVTAYRLIGVTVEPPPLHPRPAHTCPLCGSHVELDLLPGLTFRPLRPPSIRARGSP